jgi:hypothetical protein
MALSLAAIVPAQNRVEVFAEQLHGIPRRLHFQVKPVVRRERRLLDAVLEGLK